MTKIKYLLSLNRYSRNGKKENNPKGIVLHHNEFDGYGAIETRNYFDNLKNGKNAVYYSTHYIVGLAGEVICCVPEEEVAYHRGNSEESKDSVSITYCCMDKKKKPDRNTLYSIKALICEIAERYSFDISTDLMRHFDLSTIKCPMFYATNVEEWSKLKLEITMEAEAKNQFISGLGKKAKKLAAALEVEEDYINDIIQGKAQIDMCTFAKIAGILMG